MKTTDMIVQKNKCYTMVVEDLGSQGEGIGRIEEIEVLIVKVNKNFAYGKLQKILKPSPKRVSPLCDVASKCGGCQLQHLNYEGQLQYKTKKVEMALKKIAKIDDVEVLPALGMENCWRYRNKVQFPVKSDNQNVSIGFYGKRSHKD